MKITIKPKGVIEDIHAAELGFDNWNQCTNVLFPNGFASSAPGWADAVGGCLFRPLWLLPVFTPTVYYWIYVGNDAGNTVGGIGVTDGVNHFDITPAGGIVALTAGEITGGNLNGIPVINWGTAPPVFWDLNTGNICTDLPGWPVGQLAAAMRPFKYHLIAMNISDGTGDFPDLVAWSNAAVPGAIPTEWASTPDNDAGNFSLAQASGEVVDGGAIRDQFIVYKNHSTFIMQFIAGQFVFSQRGAFVTSGILARNCWAEMYGSHYVITDGDVIRHNGQEVQSLIDGRMRDYMFNQIDPDTYQTSFIVSSHSTKEVWCCFPKTGHPNPDTALVYDVRSDSWGNTDLPEIPFIARGILNEPGVTFDWDSLTNTWDENFSAWNQRQFNPTTDLLVMADQAGTRMLAHGGFNRDGAAVPVFLSMDSKDFGEPQRLKLVTAVWNQIQADRTDPDGRYFIRVGWQAETADSVTWLPRQPINAHQFNKADFLVSGRFISIEITGDQTKSWRLNSMDIDYRLQGLW